MSSAIKYGCCPSQVSANDILKCSECKIKYHYGCIDRHDKSTKSYKDLTREYKATWVCPMCLYKRPKTDLTNTPVRSGPETISTMNQSTGEVDLRLMIREEMTSLLDEFKRGIIDRFELQINIVLDRLTKVDETISSLQHKYDDVKKDLDKKTDEINFLVSENRELKTIITGINTRMTQLEQHARASNVEIQCVPEFKSENLFKTVKQISNTINYNLNEADIHVCTRTAKQNRESVRPRSIVVKFGSPRIRDEFLASAIIFNKKAVVNSEKLNSSHLGISGERRPIYVSEHLSPMMKNVHAAARAKAKSLQYKFVWIKGGVVYMRKNETTDYIVIRSLEALTQLQ